MTTTIALAGKGGVGKTTISGMIIKYLIENQSGAVLAIDADPSANLNMVLGLDLDMTEARLFGKRDGAGNRGQVRRDGFENRYLRP